MMDLHGLRERLPALLPVPPLLVAAWVAMTSKAAWVPTQEMVRKGQTQFYHMDGFVIPALMGFLVGVYALTFTEIMADVLGAIGVSRCGSMPSEGEKGCAVVLLRYAVLLVVYYLAYSLWGACRSG